MAWQTAWFCLICAMTSPFTELNDRARDVFRIVVESYLDTGMPVGSRTISKSSDRQPVAGIDPQRDAGS